VNEGRKQERDGLRRFELRWQRTWEDRSYDFAAFDGELRVGRIYRHEGGPSGNKWWWSMTAKIGNRIGTDSGTSDDRDDACLQVERHFRRFRQMIGEHDR
jgi:hypothetical protein